MPRIAFISTDPDFIGHDDSDLAPLSSAVQALGLEVSVPSWRDSSVDWAEFDLAVMRSPWDYAGALPEFLAWLDRVSGQTRILNTPEVIRWNLDKRYLGELEARAVTIVESHFCDTVGEAGSALARIDSARVVVKPTVSAGSRDTGLFERSDERALRLAEHILSLGKTVMVQPAIDSVARVGEQALVYFDGSFSHALTKGPILDLGGRLLGGVYREQISTAEATPEQRALAESAMTVMTALFRERGIAEEGVVPLYARLDMVQTESGPALLEAELFEPSYFVHTAAASEHRFASALLARLVGKPAGTPAV
jgi:hypothetical protein